MDTLERLYESLMEWKGKHSTLVWCTVPMWGPVAIVVLFWINCPVTVVATIPVSLILVCPVLWIIGAISPSRRDLMHRFLCSLAEFVTFGWD